MWPGSHGCRTSVHVRVEQALTLPCFANAALRRRGNRALMACRGAETVQRGARVAH